MKKIALCLGLAAIIQVAPALAYDVEDSLNFSSPPHSHGPFNENTAKSYYRAQNWSELLDYARAWAAAAPNNSMPFFLIGEGAIHTNNYDAAVYGFKRATQLKSDEPRAWGNLAAAYCKRQQWALASKAIADGEKSSAKLCAAYDWYVFGNARKELKDYEGAIPDYQRALRMRPNFPEATNNLGVCQYNIGNGGAAQADYKTAARQGDSVARTNANNYAAQQAAASQAQSGGGNWATNGNPYSAAAHARMLDRADTLRRTDMNGNVTPRQY